MIRYKLLVLAITFMLGSSSLTAQLEDLVGLRLSLIQYSFNNKDLPGNNGESHVSIALEAIKNVYEKGDLQFVYRAPIINDAIPEVTKLIKGESAETEGETFLTSLLPGWFQLGYNAFANGNICFSPGLFMGDFWYTAYAQQQPFSVNSEFGIIEPSGWYGALGPSWFVDYAPISEVPFVIHLETAYLFSTRFRESKKLEEFDNYDPDTQDPHFFFNRLEFRYKRIFLGYQFVKAINRYALTSDFNNGSRNEFMLGIVF